jgi:hypothetical protein
LKYSIILFHPGQQKPKKNYIIFNQDKWKISVLRADCQLTLVFDHDHHIKVTLRKLPYTGMPVVVVVGPSKSLVWSSTPLTFYNSDNKSLKKLHYFNSLHIKSRNFKKPI